MGSHLNNVSAEGREVKAPWCLERGVWEWPADPFSFLECSDAVPITTAVQPARTHCGVVLVPMGELEWRTTEQPTTMGRAMMPKRERFFIGYDQSSYTYVVPVTMRAEWEQWREIPEDDERSWTVPNFATEISLNDLFTFADWEA